MPPVTDLGQAVDRHANLSFLQKVVDFDDLICIMPYTGGVRTTGTWGEEADRIGRGMRWKDFNCGKVRRARELSVA
jgi:hypothetical protein